MASNELIALRGFLDRAANFHLRRCYSTAFARYELHSNDTYSLELIGPHDVVLARTHPEVRPEVSCTSGSYERWHVVGYVGWREGASSLRLTCEGIVLWEAATTGRPSLQVRIKGDPVLREQPIELNLEHSPGTADAFIQVVYQWGERQFQVLGYYPPAQSISLDLRAVPGGNLCRFVVHYSNGMRSTSAVTDYFEVPPTGPHVRIVSPLQDHALLPGQPLELVGQVLDRERPGGARLDEDLVWFLNDKPVARGPLACVQEPSPGRLRIRLRYEPGGVEDEVTVRVQRWETGMPIPAANWDIREMDARG